MTPPAFERFLEQLGGLLRLSRSQREAIRAEIEDHVESQVSELTAAGVPYDRAVSSVLEEFGDAAELASRFSSIGLRRRWIMRSALAASIVVVVTLATSFLMPPQAGNPLTPGSTAAHAMGGQAGPAVPTATVDEARPADEAIHKALRSTVPEVKFELVTLEDALGYIGELGGINVVVDWNVLEFEDIEREMAVTLELEEVRLERVLQLVLSLVGHTRGQIGYCVDDGVLMVSTASRVKHMTEVRLYNCGELLRAPTPSWLRSEVERSVGLLSVRRPVRVDATGTPTRKSPSTFDRQQAVLRDLVAAAQEKRTSDLRDVIQRTIDPEGWEDLGGESASITVYDDVFVIVQTPANHEAIGRLLQRLVEVRAEGE